MAETATPTARIAEQRTGGYRFYSRSRHLRLIRKPMVTEQLAGGGQRVIQEGIVYDFAPDGFITVQGGADVREDVKGWLAPGSEFLLERDVVEALRAHRLYNSLFYEEGNEPDLPLPRETDYLKAINRATLAVAPDVIKELIEQEENTHQRPVLLEVARDALIEAEAAFDVLIARDELPDEVVRQRDELAETVEELKRTIAEAQEARHGPSDEALLEAEGAAQAAAMAHDDPTRSGAERNPDPLPAEKLR
jgi:DNA-binding transcriptional MerR regulator